MTVLMGNTPADYTYNPVTGAPTPGKSVVFYVDEARTTAATGLTNEAGAAVGSTVTSIVNGILSFGAPDGTTVLYYDRGDGKSSKIFRQGGTGGTGGNYSKPTGGIPASDLAASVQSALSEATAAVLTVNGAAPDANGNVVVAGGSGGGSTVDPTDVGQDGILVVGQSNARGAGTGFDLQRLDPIDPRIHITAGAGTYANTDTIAVEPTGSVFADATIATAPPGMGPGGPFAREWVRRVPVNRVAAIIGAAFGGTAFEGVDSKGTTRQWKVGATGNTANLYEQAITLANTFLAANPKNRIVAILWIQGEQDGSNGTTAAVYRTDLDALIDGLRSRLNIPGVPFIVGQMTPETVAGSSAHAAINGVHVDTPRRKTLTGFAYGLGLGNTDPTNGTLHWNAKAQRAFGPSMYAAYQRALLNVTGTAPVAPTVAPSVTQASTTSAAVSWPQYAGRVTGYVVEVNTGSGWSTVTRAATLIDVTQTITGVAVGQTVQVRYSVVNEQGTSAPSPAGSVTIVSGASDTTSPVISSFTATAGAAQNVLSWAGSDNVGITRWTVVRSGTTVYDGTATSVTDTGLTNGTAYTYTLTAYDAAGNTATQTASATPQAAVPTYFVSDSFTDTNGVLLDAHVGEIGASWTKVSGPTGSAVIANNRVRSNTNAGLPYLPSGTPPTTADYTVEADFYCGSVLAGSSGGIMGRALNNTQTTMTCYDVRYVASTTAWQLVKIVNGTTTVLASTAATLTPGVTYHLKLEMSGTTITGSVDGTVLTPVAPFTGTDSSVTLAGRPGLLWTGTVVPTDTTGFHFDNLTAGTGSGGSNVTVNSADGTFTNSAVNDNGDGTFTDPNATDNGDGTATYN